MDMRTPAEIAQEAKVNALKERAAKVGVEVKGMTYRQAEQAVNDAEKAAMQKMWRERGLDLPKFGRV